MKSRALILTVLVGGLGCCLGGAARAQNKNWESQVSLPNGLVVVFNSETEPPGARKQALGSIRIEGQSKVIHRVFVDQDGKTYFGYDLEIEPVGDFKEFRLSVKPLTVQPTNVRVLPNRHVGTARASTGPTTIVRTYPPPSAETIPGGGRGSGRPARAASQSSPPTSRPLPKYPAPQVVRAGDTLALDVLVNPQTGVKIVDLIQVRFSGETPAPPDVTGRAGATSVVMRGRGGHEPPRDFTPEAVRMHVETSLVLINGTATLSREKSRSPGASGPIIWFYVPGHGRFILSLVPREGYDFRKVGVVERNRISFRMNGNTYEWGSSTPVVSPADDRWNLWVLYDPDFQPDEGLFEPGSFMVGAADRVEYLLKKK